MDIGEEDGDFAAGSKVLRNLDSGDESGFVGAGAQGRIEHTPVDLGAAALGEDALDDLGVENLGEVLLNEAESLLV
ncbi:hypothetical protein HG531_004395 [Fusarium graminearum]|nr:hypothetical protein HG531_004395 [Fusarium graminearum]